MKFVTFRTPDDPTPRLGIDNRDNHSYTDLTSRFPDDPDFASMLALIDGGQAALDKAWAAYTTLDAAHLVEKHTASLLAPFRPRRLRDVSLIVNHLRPSVARTAQWIAANTDDPRTVAEIMAAVDPLVSPLYEPTTPPFAAERDAGTVSAPGSVLTWPGRSDWLDYELELCAVIGRSGSDIDPSIADDHIFGYAVYNDWTLRDVQARNIAGSGSIHGDSKDFPNGNSFGPCVVTKDEIPDVRDLAMTVRVNGQVWGEGSTSEMLHGFDDAVVSLSKGDEIVAGEVWGTGTVPDGSSFELGKHLPRPAFVELEIERIGVLSHYVVPEL